MPHLSGWAGSQGMRDVSRLALPESHQGAGHDTGIQGTATGLGILLSTSLGGDTVCGLISQELFN